MVVFVESAEGPQLNIWHGQASMAKCQGMAMARAHIESAFGQLVGEGLNERLIRRFPAVHRQKLENFKMGSELAISRPALL